MPSSQPKNIVLCCDGTGNKYGLNKTNVVRTCDIAVRDHSQLVYYDPGVGTSVVRYLKSFRNLFLQAVGGGLQKNVEDGYRFLMQNYEEGDRVFLFGFSRGAFTVRSLAGMLFHCGLLHPYLDNLVAHASSIYNDRNDNLDRGFKKNFCRSCPIHFIGAWDTVESLFDLGDKFHDDQLNPEITCACHALAIDEKRGKFKPSLWDESKITPGQTVEQVWFAGAHSDVGGWYKEVGLSDISLRWMLTRAKNYGMRLNEGEFKKVIGDPIGIQRQSYTGGWRLLGAHKRQIPLRAKVHGSVRKRMERTSYQPVKELPGDVRWIS